MSCFTCLLYKRRCFHVVWIMSLINMRWWHFVSLGIRHCSLARLPASAVALQFGQSGCSTVSVLPMRMREVSGFRVCRPCWAFLCSTSNGWVPWLAARWDPKKKWKPCACQLHWFRPLCVCVWHWTMLCEPNVNLVCVLLTFFETGWLRSRWCSQVLEWVFCHLLLIP